MSARPHIIIFNPDQWRGDVMGHLGDPAAVTPNLDRMVTTDGISFRNAFCQNPVCTPSRCSFMSGWYPHVRGHRTMHHMLHPEHDEPNLLKVLKDNGYFVWWGGKNDLTPAQDSLEPYCHVKYEPVRKTQSMWQYDRQEEWRGDPKGDAFYSFFAGEMPHTEGEDHYHDSDWENTMGAVDFIKNYDGDQPLCIYLPLTYPHPPYAVEEPFFSMIDRDKLPDRVPTPESWEGKPSILAGISRNQNLGTWTEERWNELRAVYWGMCARVDHQLGMVCNALQQAGMYDDSALFFFADHGDFTGDYGLVEKTQNTFEDCLTRVPLVVKPPKSVSAKPGVIDALAELIDFTATVYDFAGIDPGYTHFGKSLRPVLTGEADELRDAVYCEGGRLYEEEHCKDKHNKQKPGTLYWPRAAMQRSDTNEHTKALMCRTKTHKYVLRLYEKDEMYDLRNDPRELFNVIDDPAYASILVGLKDRALRWLYATSDVVPYVPDRRC